MPLDQRLLGRNDGIGLVSSFGCWQTNPFFPLQTDFRTADLAANTDLDMEKNLVSTGLSSSGGAGAVTEMPKAHPVEKGCCMHSACQTVPLGILTGQGPLTQLGFGHAGLRFCLLKVAQRFQTSLLSLDRTR